MPRPRTVEDAQILAAAAETIGEVGPTMTLSAVGAKVGLSPATLVQRFGSKRGLLLAVAERGSGWAREAFRSASQENDSALDALGAALAAMASPFSAPGALANHLSFLQIDLKDPDFHRLASRHGRAMRREIHRLLDDAVDRRELERCDTGRLAEAVEAIYSGALITWAIHGGGRADRWLSRQLETLLEPYVRPS